MLTFAALLAAPALADEVEPVETEVFVAQDEEEEDEDPAGGESTVKSEKEAMKKSSSTEVALPEEERRRRIIKTIQKKNFMKIGRYEVGPSLGFVANDPFLNRLIIGAVADYHITEIFAAELQFGYAPILGQGGCDDPDWKQLSCQLLEENSVSPDISKLTAHGSLGLAFSPIYGKAAVGRRIIAFDIYGHFGLGATATQDDLVALQAEDSETAIATQNQVHPITVISGGARVAFTEGLAVRLEGKSLSYIETVNSTTLEMKNNFILQANVSFFFPGMD
jgi:outer membrane beta-barrel protein